MNALSNNVVDLLTFLLPGFVAAAVFHSLTPFPRREPFERTVQALIFTILIQAAVVVVRSGLLFMGRFGLEMGQWNQRVELVWAVFLAVALGLLSAAISNRDSVHHILRKLGVTHQTSYASEWYGALCRGNSYVVLHLNGSRRLYGWPEEWPSTPGKGHFVIVQGEWLEDSESTVLPPGSRVIVSVTDVEMVELIPVQAQPKEKNDDGRSEGAIPTTAART